MTNTAYKHTLKIGDRAVPLEVRRHPRARNIILRITNDGQGAVVTIPKRVSFSEGVAMAKSRTGWIAKHLENRPARVPFEDGAIVPLFGQDHIVCHCPDAGATLALDGELIVSGRAEHLPRRLTDWLKRRAKAEVTDRAHIKATAIGVRAGRVTVRDTHSRWGSCTSDGNLNFSWRLVMAPEYVLDYLVAHEVAHLVHGDHSPAFWALTDRLTPRMNDARDWLKDFGHGLHRYG